MLHHVIEKRVDRGAVSGETGPHGGVPPPSPCRCLFDWAAAQRGPAETQHPHHQPVRKQRASPFTSLCSSRTVSHQPAPLMPQDAAAAYVGFGDRFAAGAAGTCAPVKCQTPLNASSLFSPTTKGTHHLFIIIIYLRFPINLFFFLAAP